MQRHGCGLRTQLANSDSSMVVKEASLKLSNSALLLQVGST
uniref:Uncharacterized protein n=1 Tax=Anguilla anguilla TaxID=7936 RepID=A0A0E9QWZ7_ANGAN